MVRKILLCTLVAILSFINFDALAENASFRKVSTPPASKQLLKNPEILHELAQKFFEDKEYKRASNVVLKAVQRGNLSIEKYKSLAENGNAFGQFILGVAYLEGIGADKSLNNAIDYWGKAAAQNNPKLYLAIISHLDKGGKNVETIPWYQKAAEGGNVEAMYALGAIYELGKEEVEKNRFEALKWFETAAQNKHVKASTAAADIYLREGDEQDVEKAYQLYKFAADKGFDQAQYKLGIMYVTGKGIERNINKGVNWLVAAAKAGHIPAKVALKKLMINTSQKSASSNGEDWYAEGMVLSAIADYEGAFKAFSKAAKEGNIDAKVSLGELYAEGNGVAIDKKKAFDIYQSAAEAGNVKAQILLSKQYSKGTSFMPRHVGKAMNWAKKAVEQKDKEAYFLMGRFYRIGMGVLKDSVKAQEWFEKAYNLGHAEAAYEIAQMPEKNMVETMKWLHQAADKGHVTSMGTLCRRYAQKDDVENVQLWCQKAIDSGYKYSQKTLDDYLKKKGEAQGL